MDMPPLSPRVAQLHQQVLQSPPALCAERALLVTRYFRNRRNRRKPMVQQKAEALAQVLDRKQARIYPDELLVGCFTRHRVGGGLLPELHGVAVLEDLFAFERRAVNPFAVSAEVRRQLLTEVLPFWLPRFLALRIRPWHEALRFVLGQLDPTFYLINETGGISHVVPNYQALCERGTEGLRREASERLAQEAPDGPQASFLRAVQTACDGLEAFGRRYRDEARAQARAEPDSDRRRELEHIAEICAQVPRAPARSFHEALQTILFAQIAINLESLDNSVCPGRLDQILLPYYRRDREAGRLDDERALELLGCFAVKLCEIVPAFSRRITRFHGGMFNGQVVVVGGTDRDGHDASNELSALLLRLMAELRTRQPNYHARLHRGSPAPYRRQIARALAAGSVSPAVYNDEVIVPLLRSRGIAADDARDYATVGCVEPVAAGRSFLSTDAALVNVPLCLELALNGGRRFGHRRLLGVPTPPAERCRSAAELGELFDLQLRHAVGRLLVDLRRVEQANTSFHPTPLTSMLLEGCLTAGRDASAGGARYNGSGVQGVGVVEVGDSLAAVEAVVFRDQRATMADLVAACRTSFRHDEPLSRRLRTAPKYGNDDPVADRWTAFAMERFAACLTGERNTRNGDYAPGFYSVTAHEGFGQIVGALPSGRLAGAPFSSGLSPSSAVQRAGPTAALLSAARLPLHLAQNGINFNLELAPGLVDVADGPATVQALIDGGFSAGCMQMQLNVLDPQVLIEARDHPGRYPGLLVRVSGYSAYFDDLSPAMKQEIIDRTTYGCESPSGPAP